jgi:hypothetical protein
MDTSPMVKRIAALLAPAIVLSMILSGCKTGEDLVLPNQGMQQNPW